MSNVAITICIFDRNYALVYTEHAMVPQAIVNDPDLCSMLLCETSRQNVDARLHHQTHASAVLGHVSREEAQAHAEELRRQEPHLTAQFEVSIRESL